jgi:hypothetical protein
MQQPCGPTDSFVSEFGPSLPLWYNQAANSRSAPEGANVCRPTIGNLANH